jgi:hypothetical protein
MRTLAGVLTTACVLLSALVRPTLAQATGVCDVQYFLPIAEGASWTFAREAQPRTIENIQPDGFDVHSAFPTEYQGQPDIVDHVDTYHCGPDGLSLVQHSEIDQAAQGSQFGGLYQGVALPRTLGSGSEWEYTYVLAGGDPTQPPVDQEVRDRVTEHFKVVGRGSLSLTSGKQLAGLQVQHSINAIAMIEGVGEQPDYSTDRLDFLAEGVGWVTSDLIAYSQGSRSFEQCPDQATTDAALHSAEDSVIDQTTPTADSSGLRIAQVAQPSAALVNAFVGVGILANQVSVEARGGLERFVVRLDQSGQPLMSLAAIDQLTTSACVQPGSLQGATTLLVGALQQNGDQIRITAREVDVATGQIQGANLADGTVSSLQDTLRASLGGLPIALPGG